MQSTVLTTQGFGVQGEVFSSGPTRAKPYNLVSTTIDNTIGYAFTVTSEGVAQCGDVAVAGGAFAGILVHPKHYASNGTTAGGTLAPTLALPDNSIGELLTMGEVIVYATNTGSVGDPVYFVQATGAIGIGTAGAGQTQIPNAVVSRYDVAAAGLMVIELTN